tara:strand:- start:29 stop:286 length:258 start_codon:yes stop_codon:yes gene_type:complete
LNKKRYKENIKAVNSTGDSDMAEKIITIKRHGKKSKKLPSRVKALPIETKKTIAAAKPDTRITLTPNNSKYEKGINATIIETSNS